MKKSVRVMVQDNTVCVSYDNGEWLEVELNTAWLNVLGAICYPETHDLQVIDNRKQREAYQKKLSTDYPEE
jgi:hypothetical protein